MAELHNIDFAHGNDQHFGTEPLSCYSCCMARRSYTARFLSLINSEPVSAVTAFQIVDDSLVALTAVGLYTAVAAFIVILDLSAAGSVH